MAAMTWLQQRPTAKMIMLRTKAICLASDKFLAFSSHPSDHSDSDDSDPSEGKTHFAFMIEETSQFPNWFEQHRNQFPDWLEQQFPPRPFPDWLGQQHFIVKKFLLPFLDIVEFHNFESTCTEVCDSLSDVRFEITPHLIFTSFESKEYQG
jgi:hypothetical protein